MLTCCDAKTTAAREKYPEPIRFYHAVPYKLLETRDNVSNGKHDSARKKGENARSECTSFFIAFFRCGLPTMGCCRSKLK